MNKIPGDKILQSYLSLNCLIFGIILNTKILSIKHAYTTKKYCFWLVNVIITATLVVLKNQFMLLMLSGDDLYLF